MPNLWRAQSTPTSEAELLARAQALDGWTLGALAHALGTQLGDDPVRTKGCAGALMERALGATAGNLDQPDFPHLGIELKTIPVDARGRVVESTYICAAELGTLARAEWGASRVRRKLARVLWVPVEAASQAPLAARHIGTPRLWSPTAAEEAVLKADWSDLVGRMAIGQIDAIDGYRGSVLQLRPKAAHARVRTAVRGPEFEPLEVLPLGFYLRARFTETILWAL